jgi:two-component system, sensor histidine kinase and response regulator
MTSYRVQVVAHLDTGKSVGVLIVEDETLIASYIDAVLGMSGFRVVGIAGSGPEALVLAAETRPSLALVDIRLSGPLDGTELACLLRDRLAIPAIFVSGLLDREILQRAKAAQPLAFIRKPLSPSQLFNAIDRALRKVATFRLPS